MNTRRNYLATFTRPRAGLPLSEPITVVLTFVAVDGQEDATMCELVQDLNRIYSTDQWVGEYVGYFGEWLP